MAIRLKARRKVKPTLEITMKSFPYRAFNITELKMKYGERSCVHCIPGVGDDFLERAEAQRVLLMSLQKMYAHLGVNE